MGDFELGSTILSSYGLYRLEITLIENQNEKNTFTFFRNFYIERPQIDIQQGNIKFRNNQNNNINEINNGNNPGVLFPFNEILTNLIDGYTKDYIRLGNYTYNRLGSRELRYNPSYLMEGTDVFAISTILYKLNLLNEKNITFQFDYLMELMEQLLEMKKIKIRPIMIIQYMLV